MSIPIKTPGEIALMRSSGRLAWSALQDVVRACQVGVTTRELDGLARQAIAGRGCEPLLLGYTIAKVVEYPGAACVSVNEEVVHATPSDRILRDGDVVTIDLALRDPVGWCADAATTVVVGTGSRGRELTATATTVLAAAIGQVRPGVWWSQVAQAALLVASKSGCALVPGYCGHGIGRNMHETPRLCFGASVDAEDVCLQPGMVITIEPIVVEGKLPDLVTLGDGWTVVTANRAWAAHEERTVAVTRRGCEVLTCP